MPSVNTEEAGFMIYNAASITGSCQAAHIFYSHWSTLLACAPAIILLTCCAGRRLCVTCRWIVALVFLWMSNLCSLPVYRPYWTLPYFPLSLTWVRIFVCERHVSYKRGRVRDWRLRRGVLDVFIFPWIPGSTNCPARLFIAPGVTVNKLSLIETLVLR